jgi:histidinol dehydrogenase
MLKIYRSSDEFFQAQKAVTEVDGGLRNGVAEIIAGVQKGGDAALRRFTEKFDGAKLTSFPVPRKLIDESLQKLDAKLRETLQRAIENVSRFHEKQRPKSWLEESADGSRMGLQFNPIQNAGIYVPGGRAAYPSTVIMTVVPAQIAGVDRIALVSPPTCDGGVNSLVLAVAGLLGIGEIYAVGGAQAIAALTYGTETIPRVDKIVGPGNAYVNEAKRQVFGVVGIDSLAGPSEVVILADETARAEFVSRDLLAQAEHDPDARTILVTTSERLVAEVVAFIESVLPKLPRKEIAQESLAGNGGVVFAKNCEEGIDIVNRIAPEHLQIFTRNADEALAQIRNAGAIFFGEFSPVAIGDYFAGSNHVLPTAGTARFASPLGVWDFMKCSSVVHYSKERFQTDAPHVARFAESEGLINHQLSVECRNE